MGGEFRKASNRRPAHSFPAEKCKRAPELGDRTVHTLDQEPAARRTWRLERPRRTCCHLAEGAGTLPICRSANGAAYPRLVIPPLLLAGGRKTLSHFFFGQSRDFAPSSHGASDDRRTSFGASLRKSSQPSNSVGREPSQRNWTVTGGWVIIDMVHQGVSSEGRQSISEAICREHTFQDAYGDWAAHHTWRPPMEPPLAPCIGMGDGNG